MPGFSYHPGYQAPGITPDITREDQTGLFQHSVDATFS